MHVSDCWTKYLPWVTTALLGGYVIYKAVQRRGTDWVNKSVQKDCPKVVNVFDIEDLGDKAVFCRCWRSKQFPKCDGSHTAHNKCTGDNVGPLVIQKPS